MRFFKPARSKEFYRGYFSYLTEAVGNLVNYYDTHGYESNIILYFDLYDIPGYGTGNMYNVAFEQDDYDYKSNSYNNIEEYRTLVNPYNTDYDKPFRLKTERIIEKHFKLNEDVKSLLHTRFLNYDLSRTIGIHYRTTDITMHHPIVDINKIFKIIDNEDFDHIFLTTDSNIEYLKFKERYGDKILFFDKTASDDSNVFFKKNNPQELINEHIKEMVFNVFALSKTKKLICSRSNVSTFSILANSNLEFNIIS